MSDGQDAAVIIEKIVQKLTSDYSPKRIILFGSYAYGIPHEDSDIDLLIVKDTAERFIDRWTTVRKILSDRERKVAVETLILTPSELDERLAAGDQFIAKIVEDGKILYAA